ncbi:MAG: DinB family protein [Ignavibacteriaceae bacterium]
MLTTALVELFNRDLDILAKEINSYSDELKLWVISRDINNSAGNLCLHICGNLQHFIGAILGNTGYVRNRDAEFGHKNIPKKELLSSIDNSKEVVKTVLSSLSEDQIAKDYPIDVFKKKMTTSYFLIHLHSHLNYHLGQINYHRRLL